MTIKKINLSALNKANSIENNTSSEDIIENDVIIPEISNVQEEPVGKKKFSLKDLKINTTEKSTENVIIDSGENTKTEIIPEIKETTSTKISLKNLGINKPEIVENLTEEKLEITNIDSENQINEIKEITKEEPKEEMSTFSFTDGDTSCNIIKEEKLEIFSSYKGSFAKVEEKKETKIEEKKAEEIIKTEEKLPEVSVIEAISNIEEPNKIENLEIKETSEITAEEIKVLESKTEEINKTPEIILPETQNPVIDIKLGEKTNLERYSESELLNKNNRNKKIIVGVFSLMFVVGLSVFAFKNIPTKSNISEINNQSEEINVVKDTPVTPEVNQNTDVNNNEEIVNENTEVNNNPEVNTPENIEQNNEINPETNNITTQEPNIVKENNENTVDINNNNSNINKKLHNYLIQKYKSK